MSSPPPSGSAPNLSAPPQPPRVPTTRPDRGVGLALAGFLLSLAAFIAALLVTLVALFEYDAVPGFSGVEGAWLLVATFPVALVGLTLSALGRHSTSRRGLAITGVVLSVLTLVLLLPIMAWLAAVIIGLLQSSQPQLLLRSLPASQAPWRPAGMDEVTRMWPPTCSQCAIVVTQPRRLSSRSPPLVC